MTIESFAAERNQGFRDLRRTLREQLSVIKSSQGAPASLDDVVGRQVVGMAYTHFHNIIAKLAKDEVSVGQAREMSKSCHILCLEDAASNVSIATMSDPHLLDLNVKDEHKEFSRESNSDGHLRALEEFDHLTRMAEEMFEDDYQVPPSDKQEQLTTYCGKSWKEIEQQVHEQTGRSLLNVTQSIRNTIEVMKGRHQRAKVLKLEMKNELALKPKPQTPKPKAPQLSMVA